MAGVSDGRDVSVGVTNANLFDDHLASNSFAEAVRGAMKVSHRHVASTLAVETAGDKRWAVLWERFPGQTLDAVLSERGTLLPDEAVSITVAVAQALTAAHEAGVLHGSVAPEWVTLVLGPQGLDTKLGGFGLGLLSAFTGGRKPTIASDVMALGSMLHQLLTGEVPQGRVGKLPNNALHLGSVLTKSLGMDVSGRFRNVIEFEKALGEANRTHVSGGHVLPQEKAKPGGIGLRTLGPWELVSLLGEGAMGQVFLGKHSLLGRQAAIKVLRPEQYQREDLIQRFFQEARSVNQINHEHIVEISDFGKELGPDGQPTAVYFVMELLQGETLTSRLAKGPLPIERSLHVIRQLASALAAAHKLGVVHRDVKTDNVFLIKRQNDSEYVKVLDFGVAKLTQPTAAAPTVSTMDGAIIGTPTSMSPEQASGGVVDQRADVYAVGVLLYLLLAGRLPIDADNFGKLIALLLTKPPPPLPAKNKLGEDIPSHLAALTMRCLEKDPSKRPQSMEQLIDELTAPVELDQPPSRRGFFFGVGALALVGIAAAAYVALKPSEVVETASDAGAAVAQVEVDAGLPDGGLAVAIAPETLDSGAAGAADEPDAGQLAVEGPVDAGSKVAVKPLPPKVKLTRELVAATLGREQHAVRKCFERFPTLLPAAAGSMKVKWTILDNGEVTGVELMEPAFKGSALDTCITRAVKSFRFPRNTGPPQTMTIPFTYAARGG